MRFSEVGFGRDWAAFGFGYAAHVGACVYLASACILSTPKVGRIGLGVFLRARWDSDLARKNPFFASFHSCSRFTPAQSLTTSVLVRGSEFLVAGSPLRLYRTLSSPPPLPSAWGGLSDEYFAFPSSCSDWAVFLRTRKISGGKVCRMDGIL